MMQVRYTKGRQLCYKEHIVNLYQDIANIASTLPRLPETIDIVIIRRDGVDLSQHVDFIVRREKVRNALLYKKAHDPNYATLEIDEVALNALPQNSSVVGSVATCREGRQEEAPIHAPGPQNAAMTVIDAETDNSRDRASDSDNTDGDGDGEEDQQISGVLNLGNNNHAPEVTRVRTGVNTLLEHPTNEQQHIVSFISFNPEIELRPPQRFQHQV